MVYDGEWDAPQIAAWARLMDHPTVGFADSQHIRNFFQKEGTLVHLFITKESVEGDVGTFMDFLFHEVSIPVIEQKIMKRGTFSVVFSYAEENKDWLKNTALDNGHFPTAMIVDFVRTLLECDA